jgi:hypothetical protein
MNLVSHPSSSDRFVPSHGSKSKRRSSALQSGQTSPVESSASSSYRADGHVSDISAFLSIVSIMRVSLPPFQSSAISPALSPQTPVYGTQGYPYTPQSDSVGFHTSNNYGPPPDSSHSWNYPAQERNGYVSQALPSMNAYGRAGAPSTSTNGPGPSGAGWHSAGAMRESDAVTYRAWPAEGHYSVDNSSFPGTGPEPSLRPPTSPASSHFGGDGNHWQQQPTSPSSAESASPCRYNQEQYAAFPPPPSLDNSAYNSAGYFQHHSQAQFHSGNYPQNQNVNDTQNTPIPPQHTYTRTLVGPLSANACRLVDEHQQPGILFLFQDLSVRTEGNLASKEPRPCSSP